VPEWRSQDAAEAATVGGKTDVRLYQGDRFEVHRREDAPHRLMTIISETGGRILELSR
jgi:hypothetical protein